MLALEHQYAVTSPLPELAANADNEATLPIVRHHDAGLYLRDHADRVGIGSFNHRRLPIGADELDSHPRREDGLAYAFTPEDFDGAWALATELMPALESATLERRFNGVFAFTPDGYPLIGSHPELDGFWVAESVWITHSAGVGRVVAETLVEGASSIDASPADLSRFADVELAAEVYEARCDDSYRDVYAVHHPAEGHTSARDLRFSPFAERHRALGAVWFDGAGGWERPRWFEANAGLVDADIVPHRDAWSSRFWSTIALAEHRAVRERVGLFDITPLTRIEVSGPDAESYLSWMLAGDVRRAPGTVTYTVMLDDRGGILSDVTVTRLDGDRFLVGANGPRDVATLKAHAPAGVRVEDVTSRTCGLGLWGPAARDVLTSIVDSALDNVSFPYLSTQQIRIGEAPVTAMRISYAGELGWELITGAEWAESVWDALWGAGESHGMLATGTAALGTLRLEKGYRAWGVDLTPEYTPEEAGLGFTVRGDRTEFRGAGEVEARRKEGPRAFLRHLMLDGDQVAMGGEPVLAGRAVVGFVTSAGYGASVGRSLAYAWLMPSIVPGNRVTIRYFDHDLGATVDDRGSFDPLGARLRS
jgi:glycine cleavage system aminomethyltransferase T